MKFRLTTTLLAAALLMGATPGVFSQASEQPSATYTFTDLGTLGGNYPVLPADINALSQIVGHARTGTDTGHAVLWQNGVVTDLGTLGALSSSAHAINDSGQVVGSAGRTLWEDVRAFVWQNGIMADLSTPAGTSTVAVDINPSGQIVGWASTPDGTRNALLWQNGGMTNLGTLGGLGSYAFGINASGQVVGSRHRTDGWYHAFQWQNGVMTDLGDFGTEGGRGSSASGINESGQVVGDVWRLIGWDYETGEPFYAYQAVLWQNGVVTDLGTLGGVYSEANDINTWGQVVGRAQNERAFLWQNGVMTDLNTLLPPGSGWWLYNATAINDSGQIVGFGRFNNQDRGFLLTPVAPQTVAFTVEAQTFGVGGQGCWQGPFPPCGGAYYDETPGNWGDAQVRPGTDVDLWYDDGGIVIGGLDGLEWLTFPVTVPQSGYYTVTFRTASPADRPEGSGVVNVGVYGVAGSWIGNQTVPVTGGPGDWHTYATWQAPTTIYLPAGAQTLTLWAAGGWYNVRSMTFTPKGR